MSNQYVTSINMGNGVRLDFFTSNMFRLRLSTLKDDACQAKYEIPFAVGKTDNWEPVSYDLEKIEKGFRTRISTDRIDIYYTNPNRLMVLDKEGNQLYPTIKPIVGLFQNKCVVFDSAGALNEPNNNSRFCHWFYNHETGLYDIFLKEDAIKDIFYICGTSYKENFRLFNTLVGAAPMPLRKTFGYNQTQWLKGYKGNQALLVRTAKTFREKGIPCDTLIIDLEWGDGPSPDNKTWGTGIDWADCYKTPNSPEDMIKELKDMHFQVVLIHHSIPDYPNRCNEGWVGSCFDAQTWWDAMQQRINEGVVGTWQDTRRSEVSDSRIYTELQKRLGYNHRAYYITCYESFLRTNWAKYAQPLPIEQQVGGRRYPYSWTGDMSYLTWDELEFQVQAITNENGSMRGIPYLTNDCMHVGGSEISIRSIQFICFNSIARAHNCKPWQAGKTMANFGAQMDYSGAADIVVNDAGGDDDELIGLKYQDPVQEEITKKFLLLRYRLLPYIYTVARENYDTGMPISRPMMVAFEDDKACQRNQWPCQYMFGDSFLVAPVVAGGDSMQVYLPAECDWIDYFTKQRHKGGQIITVDTTDLSVMPLFVRAGAIIPMQDRCEWIEDNDVLNTLHLDIFADQKSTFKLYEDDGHSLGYMEDKFAFTDISYTVNDHVMDIVVGPTVGEYEGMPLKRTVKVTIFVDKREYTAEFEADASKETRFSVQL